ncbi:Fur family transcriptional regulator [Terrisporobacter sp.]|uniref:Fur family transcriptional regulator n=1 Tax=Terrisporobacter sp. TaxID=1965305 RepID=UPI0026395308|nr:transcriptional repressor [Terrisporobacter sp.]
MNTENNLLKSANLKSTKKRLVILSVLNNSISPLTSEEILEEASKEVNMNLSTIYRALAALTEKGILLKQLSNDGKTYYQINNRQHKHQLVCSLCNKVVLVDCCPLKKFENELCEDTGFTITSHNLEFSGICPECAKKL